MRIAILGSAPASLPHAPIGEPGWSIWGCSIGVAKAISAGHHALSAWFEMHPSSSPQRWQHRSKPREYEDYAQWLESLACPVYMLEEWATIPHSVRYPKDKMVEKYGDKFFTSSVAWMLAEALECQDLEEIGLWGVDMATRTEYEGQRAGCHFFLEHARQRGIRITVPPQSDLMSPGQLYGYHFADPKFIKMQSRKNEHNTRVSRLRQQKADAEAELAFLEGALDELDYHEHVWAGNGDAR